jgi:uncharacterized metal-binding protein
VPFIVAIDGCSKGCAKKVLEHAKLPIKNYLVVTDRGIEKNKDRDMKMEVIDKFKVFVKNSLTGKRDTVFSVTI